MREWLILATELTIPVIDAMALVIILVGTIQAFVTGMRMLLAGESAGDKRREVWLRYARVLVAGLTFQLAADIVETSITIGWESVARLGIIAVIRTFLNFFLEHDLTEIRNRRSSVSPSAESKGAVE